jgi:CRP/FNR family transcriptional regulator
MEGMKELQNEIIASFPSFEKGLIQEIVRVADEKYFKAGEIMIRTGQYIKSSLLVLDGLIKIYREDREGNEFFMYYINGGKACTLSLSCTKKPDASGIMAKAVADSIVLSIPLAATEQWMTLYKSWDLFIINSYKERIEELFQTIDHIAFRNMDERLLYYLKRSQEKLKINKIEISITEIAHELNSSREVISRLLKKLSERGLLEVHRNYIEVINLNKIRV